MPETDPIRPSRRGHPPRARHRPLFHRPTHRPSAASRSKHQVSWPLWCKASRISRAPTT